MEIVDECLGLQTDKKIFEFFKTLYKHYLPKLTCRVSFARQAANLWKVKQQLFEYIAKRFADTIVVLDSFTIPVCRFARARHSNLIKGISLA